MGSLAQSMALMLEEFYRSLTAVGVSALTGEGSAMPLLKPHPSCPQHCFPRLVYT